MNASNSAAMAPLHTASRPNDRGGLDCHPSIFREYDIRGTVGKTLDATIAYHVGAAFGTSMARRGFKTVAVGFDGRLSSPAFVQAVIDGLIRTGCQVINVGMCPTPLLYFAVKHLDTDAGIMVTGSHNPGDMNGFKMTTREGPFFGAEIQVLARLIAAGNYDQGHSGMVHSHELMIPAYTKRLVEGMDALAASNLTVAWDCGNGAAGTVIHQLIDKMPGQHILLYDEVDGRFPNHHPDPTVDANLQDLIRTVRLHKCDLGIAFDGDADRIGVVDNEGNVIRCDMLLALYAAEVLKTHPGATIIGDIKCSKAFFDEVGRLGGNAVMWKTGHSVIKSKMAETKAPLAGELSGHIFFADKYYGFDDGLYCAVRLLELIAASGKTLKQLMAGFPPSFSTPEIRFEVDESRKFALIDEIRTHVRQSLKQNPDWKINDIDGVRVDTKDGWWLLRASNTQNALTARIEGKDATALSTLKAQLVAAGRHVGLEIDLEEPDHHS